MKGFHQRMFWKCTVFPLGTGRGSYKAKNKMVIYPLLFPKKITAGYRADKHTHIGHYLKKAGCVCKHSDFNPKFSLIM